MSVPHRLTEIPQPTLVGLRTADQPERWDALGFAVSDRRVDLGAIRITLGARGHRGITAWELEGIPPTDEIDGLPTSGGSPAPMPTTHPNGATGIDHIVIATPDFDRTARALEAHGMALRRIRDVGEPLQPNHFRQGFRRLGPAILELVEVLDAPPGPARFWGLVVIVSDLTALADRLGEQLGQVRPAIQPGRRIATLKPSAHLGQKLAFMDPEPG
jgi:hypothetical protein